MVKLKRLKIQKFRNVAPGTELHFRDSLNVLLGKNGTGKTTLLNLIVSLLRWDFSSLLKEPFEIEYDLEGPKGLLTVLLRNKPRSNLPRFSPEDHPASRELLAGTLFPSAGDYEASGEIILSGGELELAHTIEISGSTLTLRSLQEEPKSFTLNGPIFDSGAWLNILIALESIGYQQKTRASSVIKAMYSTSFDSKSISLVRFDESLSYLNYITTDGQAFAASRLVPGDQAAYHIAARHGGPREIRNEIKRQLERSPDIDEIRVQTEDKSAEFLERAVHLLGFESVKVRIQRTARNTEPFESIKFGNIRFDFTRRDRSIINHQLLSYGQKRLLSFYYYLACSPAAVVADELVNGMHHEWIEACMDELEGRQAFLTSQNPLLLDYLHFESVDEVLSSFVLCRTEPVGEREQLHWENMTREDAQGFFDAYQVGIQHVSEILRTRGLW